MVTRVRTHVMASGATAAAFLGLMAPLAPAKLKLKARSTRGLCASVMVSSQLLPVPAAAE